MANLLKAVSDPRYEKFNYDEKRRALFGITGDERAKAMTDVQLDELSQKLVPVTPTVTKAIAPIPPERPQDAPGATISSPSTQPRTGQSLDLQAASVEPVQLPSGNGGGERQRVGDTINPEEWMGEPPLAGMQRAFPSGPTPLVQGQPYRQKIGDTTDVEQMQRETIGTTAPEDMGAMVGQFFTGMATWGAGVAGYAGALALETPQEGGIAPSVERPRKVRAFIEGKGQDLAEKLFPLTDEGKDAFQKRLGAPLEALMTPANMVTGFVRKLLKNHPEAEAVVGDITQIAMEILTFKGLHVAGKALGGPKPRKPVDLTEENIVQYPPSRQIEGPSAPDIPVEHPRTPGEATVVDPTFPSMKGRPYTPQQRPQLPPGQEFGLQGAPYEGPPVRGPGRQITGPQGEPPRQLLPGQGFELVPKDPSWPYVSPKDTAPKTDPLTPKTEAVEAEVAADPFSEPTELGAGFNPFPKRVQRELARMRALSVEGSKDYKALTKQLDSVKSDVELYSTIYEPDPGIANQVAASKFILEGNIDAYIDTVASHRWPGEEGSPLSARRMYHATKGVPPGIASHLSPQGYPVADIRKSGAYTTKEYENALKRMQGDVRVGTGQLAAPHWWIPGVEGKQIGNVIDNNLRRPINDMQVAHQQYLADDLEMLRVIAARANILPGSKRDIILEEIAEQIYTEDLGLPTSQLAQKPEILEILKGLDQSDWQPMLEAGRELRQHFNEKLRQVNRIREVMGLDPIPELGGYVPHVRARVFWDGRGDVGSVDTKTGPMPDYIQPKRIFNPHELTRRELAEYNKVRGGIRLAMGYGNVAARELFYNPIIQHGRAHAMTARAQGKPNLADSIDAWMSEGFAKSPAKADKFLASLGLPGDALMWGINFAGSGIKRSALPMNYTFTLFKQSSSMANTVALTDTVSSTRALTLMWNPKILREVLSTYAAVMKSTGRQRLVEGGVGGPKPKGVLRDRSVGAMWDDFTTWGLSEMERVTVIHAGTAAYLHGKKLGYDGRELYDYMSDTQARAQSMYDKTNLPGVLRNRSINQLLPFNTFGFEVANILAQSGVPGAVVGTTGKGVGAVGKVVDKIPGVRKLPVSGVADKIKQIPRETGGSGAHKDFTDTQWKRIKMLTRWYAAMQVTSMAHEYFTGRDAWSIPGAFLPIIGPMLGIGSKTPNNRRSITSLGQCGWDLYKAMDLFINKANVSGLRKWTNRWVTPAGGWVEKMYQGIDAVYLRQGEVRNVAGDVMFDIDPDHYWRALAFGPHNTPEGIEYWGKKGDKKKPKTHRR